MTEISNVEISLRMLEKFGVETKRFKVLKLIIFLVKPANLCKIVAQITFSSPY